MTIQLNWRRAVASVAAICLAALLSGCMLTSEQPLVSADEGVEAFAEGFTMSSYKLTDGTYLPTGEDAMSFTMRDDKSYASGDGTINAVFVPLEDDEYMLVINGKDGSMYGQTRTDGGILEIRMVLDGDPESEIAAAGITAPLGVTFADGGAMLTDRASLDAMIELLRSGTIKTSPLVAWIGTGAAPDAILPDGDWYRAQ